MLTLDDRCIVRRLVCRACLDYTWHRKFAFDTTCRVLELHRPRQSRTLELQVRQLGWARQLQL